MQPVQQWSDSFGNLQARGERSRVDIISTTDFNSERLKKITSGSVDASAQFYDEKNHMDTSYFDGNDFASFIRKFEIPDWTLALNNA